MVLEWIREAAENWLGETKMMHNFIWCRVHEWICKYREPPVGQVVQMLIVALVTLHSIENA